MLILRWGLEMLLKDWIESDMLYLLNMRSQMYLDHHYEFNKVLKNAGGESNSFLGEISF